ncbi:MAG: ribosome maturation factor RimP [Gemmatimonadota bacterium]
MSQALQDLLSQEVSALGFDLVEFRKGGTSRRPLLDVRIDRTDGAKVSVDDCAHVSRALEPLLEASGLVGDQYVLEVSSPGVERRLRNGADWRRFAGRRAMVTSKELGGRVEVQIIGVEGEGSVEVGVMRDSHGTERRIPMAAISEARLVLIWK